MSRRHRAPVLAFFAMAVVCTVVLAYSIRGSAADGIPMTDPGLRVTTSPGQTLVLEQPSVDGPPADVEAVTAAASSEAGSDVALLRPPADYDRSTRAAQNHRSDKSDRPGRGLGRSPSTHPGRGHGLDKAHPGKGKAKGHSRAGHPHGKARGHSKARHGKAKGHGKRGKARGHGKRRGYGRH